MLIFVNESDCIVIVPVSKVFDCFGLSGCLFVELWAVW